MLGASTRDSLHIMPGLLLVKAPTELCGIFSNGFQLRFHMPDELPQFSNGFINIPIERSISISIKPKMMKTSNGLRSYDPHVRGCYFKHERKLRFFKSYSEAKCELECLANFTAITCGCVRFFMPSESLNGFHFFFHGKLKCRSRSPGDVNTTVCSMFDMDCFTQAEEKFTNDAIVEQCDCLPDCSSIEYDHEMSQTQFHFSVTSEYQKSK